MFLVTVAAVAKVVVAVLVGAYSSAAIPFPKQTLKAFSFLITNVMLPCLTIANTAPNVSLELLQRCSVLIFFSVLLILLGILSAIVLSRLLFYSSSTRPGGKDTGVPQQYVGSMRLELLHTIHDADIDVEDLLHDDDEEAFINEGIEANRILMLATTTTATATAPTITPEGRIHADQYVVAVIVNDSLRNLSTHALVDALEVPSVETEKEPGYYWGSWVGCSIQNTVTLPLSILQSLSESIAWLDITQGIVYIFVFRIVCTVYLWGAGSFYVDRACTASRKLRRIRLIIQRHKARQKREQEVARDVAARRRGDVRADEQDTPLDWASSSPIRVLYESEVASHMGHDHSVGRLTRFVRSAKSIGHQLVTNVPLMAVVVAFAIGLAPPLRTLLIDEGAPLQLFMDAITMVAQGSVPASLLLLGVNLAESVAASKAEATAAAVAVAAAATTPVTTDSIEEVNEEMPGKDTGEAVRSHEREEEDEDVTDATARSRADGDDAVVVVAEQSDADSPSAAAGARDAEGWLDAFLSCWQTVLTIVNPSGVRKDFILGVSGVRLILSPAVSALVLMVLVKLLPGLFGRNERSGSGVDKTLVLVLVGELAAPTAINSALLFNQHEFMAGPWAKLLLLQYVMCAVTMVMWTSLMLSWISGLE